MSTLLSNALSHHRESAERTGARHQRSVRELKEHDRDCALRFLSEDPLSGVHLRSMIEDRGLCHPAHRGSFFGYFEDDRLAGVALLGHVIMICATPEAEPAALSYFAKMAAEIGARGHVVFGPQEQVETFWKYLSARGRETRQANRHHWYVCRQARLPLGQLQLRRAGLDELGVVADAQAEMALEESGVDPRVADPEGFRRRVADRIEKGRTWVKIEDGKVVFKAELQSVTEEVVYLEGIWTHQDYRGRGIAKSCMTELVHRLLRRHLLLCLAVEPEHKAAQHVYRHVGFEHEGDYQARYLKAVE